MHFVIEGPPRTKKNHGRRIKRGRRIFHVPSEACTNWTDAAVVQLSAQWSQHYRLIGTQHLGAWRFKVNVRALIYRDANRGDAVGYYQAIADALEAAGVVEDDKLCVSWDGSRMFVDKARPRVEITLEPAP